MNSKGKVLITGLHGFTGDYVAALLTDRSFDCYGLDCDLLNRKEVEERVCSVKPDYVIHLAGKSFVAEIDVASVYQSNIVGTLNLLDALVKLKVHPKKVILASSASVYGNSEQSPINELMTPKPISHYGCSKLSMEYMVEEFSDRLPLLIVRPFNYTGIGHSEKFLIPKIVRAYQDRASRLEVGNLNVYREFNDVRDVSEIYVKLLTSVDIPGPINICSGRSISLLEIIKHMNKISGSSMNVISDQEFVRKNEVDHLAGSTDKLQSCIQFEFEHSIEDTLHWMFFAS